MTLTKLQTTILAIAGFTALLIGTLIALAPHAFYAGNGIDLAGKVDLLSELRAPGLNLAVLGGVMLAGLVRPRWRTVAIATSLIVFIAFPLGRLLSVIVDGWPSTSIQIALVVELGIAAACVFAFVLPPGSPRGDKR
ncbi:MAG: DUF4345 domain-containing protein [Pseudomonadota bacterium]